MEQTERETVVDSLRGLESYYQSKYEHYLAMATEAKEHRERVGLLLQDLCRDVSGFENNFVDNGSININEQQNNRSQSKKSSDDKKTSPLLPSTESPESCEEDSIIALCEVDSSSAAIVPEQIKKFMSDLSIAMSVIESVSNSDSGKTLHQNYLHHQLNNELNIELSQELVELYLEEAVVRGYLELDEFDNNCYRGKPKSDSFVEVAQLPSEDLACDKAIDNEQLSFRKSGSPYDLPDSDKLKPTLLKTIEGYIGDNSNKSFSIEDVINYLYPQHTQLNWDKALKNKVRISISNVLCRKAYLGKHWSRIKPGVYRPRNKKNN